MFIGGDYVGHPSHIGRKCVFNRIVKFYSSHNVHNLVDILSLVMSLMVSFCAVPFPTRCLG